MAKVRHTLRLDHSTILHARRLKLTAKQLGIVITWEIILTRGTEPIDRELRLECTRRGLDWGSVELAALRSIGNPTKNTKPGGMRWHKASGFIDDDGV